MADLLNVDASAEGDLLPSIAFGTYTMVLIPEIAGRDRWVMADLLRNKFALIPFCTTLTQEDLTQKRVKRLLDAITRFATSILLTAKGRQEPLQDSQDPALGSLLVRWSTKEVRMLYPVPGELGG
ncbi:hypothetical protein Tdes44962_MAKER01871 [Teratosphaeria destructans]|uniref:Uncharacterized protein n=1 Tax=Teratosphaeria destructans TaxID=418781 RepID=A0A9W7SW05_9PEZI|nr:hypothetical protein Tdes44962_MAKER01871 [Teratosphaeria destructans]